MNAKLGFRKLKEQQSRKKIDHPLSKYNNLGQVTCIVCNLPLKNELLWEPHLLGRKHKEAVAALKLQAKSPKVKASKSNPVSQANDQPTTKKRKHEEASPPPMGKPAQKVYREETTTAFKLEEKAHSILPSDFFDNGQSQTSISEPSMSSSQVINKSESPESKLMTSSATISEKLPEGFFDDAKTDAKVRKVEYVDKKEEEWEEFQKMIAEETKVSENLQAEEEDEIKVERDLAEYGALKQYLTRVDKLKQIRNTQKQLKKSHEDPADEAGEQASAESENELEDILNWRSKKA